MERKIGEIFEYNGEWYQCIIGHCNQCSFDEAGTCKFIGNPYCAYRNDKKLACFKKLEKVGEPYDFDGQLFQSYRTFEVPIFTENYDTVRELGNNSKISIEIKQTKEDMEEKELTYEELLHYYHSTVGLWAIDRNPQEVHFDWICKNAFQLGMDKILSNFEKIGKNSKPFNLEAAKAGKPVCTRDGRKARIISFDRRLFYKNVSYPILALVERSDGEDDVCGYNEKGKVLIEDGAEYKDDLMMLPEKKEGWVNIYKERIYSTKEEAIEATYDGVTYIDTIKISWEE